MQNLKISIEGNYFDCQLYRGRLYLWTFDGQLNVYDWNKLVNSLIENETDKLAFTFSFLNGNYLYKNSIVELFKDKDFKDLLLKKFEKLHQSYSISLETLKKFLIGEQDTPSKMLPTDTEIYNNKLYYINYDGLFSATAHRKLSEKYLVSSRPKKLWDCKLISIKANEYPQIALSGGDEGLFELNNSSACPNNLEIVEEKGIPIFKISDEHSSFANYSYLNIYNTSTIKNSFLATFRWNNDESDKPLRVFDDKITEESIFKMAPQNNFFSWGASDKIYLANERGFEIVKYNYSPNKDDEVEVFERLDSFIFQQWKGEIINGGTTYFGNIVECENALVVILSNGESMTIPGPITRWRVYARSKNYENHLHVILDESIEIYSFNQDYFLEQNKKTIGTEFKEKISFWRKNNSYFESSLYQ